MLQIIDYSQKISEKCFTDEERNILEFTVNTQKISIVDQINHYFTSACYDKDEESLYRLFILVKEENLDLIYQLAQYKSVLTAVLNPYVYEQRTVTTGNREEGKGSVSDNTADNNTKNNSLNANITNSFDNSGQLSTNRTANSQTNTVRDLNDVWENWEITNTNKTKLNIIKGEDFGEANITTSEKQIPTTITSEKFKKHPYQNFSINQQKNQDYTNTYTDDLTYNENKNHQDLKSKNLRLSQLNADKRETIREYSVGENILKAAKVTLPKYRSQFWSKFNQYFIYSWS